MIKTVNNGNGTRTLAELKKKLGLEENIIKNQRGFREQ